MVVLRLDTISVCAQFAFSVPAVATCMQWHMTTQEELTQQRPSPNCNLVIAQLQFADAARAQSNVCYADPRSAGCESSIMHTGCICCMSLIAQHSMAQYGTPRHSTAQHGTARHSTAQHTQHGTAHTEALDTRDNDLPAIQQYLRATATLQLSSKELFSPVMCSFTVCVL